MSQKPKAVSEHVERIRKALLKARPDNYGVIKCEEPGLFFVRITPAVIDRTLSFIERVAWVAAENGYPIDHQGATGFTVNGISVCAFFSEVIRRIDHVPTKEEMAKPWYDLIGPQRFDFVGSGELKVEFAALAGRRAFADKARLLVESQIDEMMRALVELEALSKKQLEEIAKRTAASREAERRREEVRMIAETRRQAIAELEAEATNWVRVSNLRSYISAVEERVTTQPDAAKATDWINMARAHVQSIDPMQRRLVALSGVRENEKPPSNEPGGSQEGFVI